MRRPWSRRNKTAWRQCRPSSAPSHRAAAEVLEFRTLLAAAPAGTEFGVAAALPGDQTAPALALMPDGGYLAVWQSAPAGAGTPTRVWAGRFDAQGAARGEPFLVAPAGATDQVKPVVAVDGHGRSTVVWQNRESSGSAWDIWARRFEADMSPLDDPIQVNTLTDLNQLAPTVAADAAGNVVIAWADAAHDGSAWGVFARRFDPAGTPQGVEFVVNQVWFGVQTMPAAAAADGRFVIAWAHLSDEHLPDAWSVHGQRFAADGTRLGDPIEISTARTVETPMAAAAAAATGEFVVAWAGAAPAGQAGFGIHARRYYASGAALGEPFLVSANHQADQALRPSLAVGGPEEFVVAWQGVGTGGDGKLDVFAREYGGPSGGPRGDDFRLNTLTTEDDQAAPAVAAAPGGASYLAVWQTRAQNGPDPAGDWDLIGQVFAPGDANDPPSHSAVPDTTVSEDAADTAIDLYALVADDRDADAVLTYEIVANTNPALFSSAAVVVTPESGTLRLDYAPDASGEGRVDVRVTDTAGLSVVVPFQVVVTPVNDAPVNTVPAAQQTAANVPLVFSAANGNAISVADVDAGDGPVRVTLTSVGGDLTLGTTDGLTFFSGDGAAEAAMSFEGTLAAINAALDGMRYVPTATFSGPGSVTVASDDQGHTGSGGALGDSDSVSVAVTEPPPPAISVAGATVTEGDGATVDAVFTVTLSEARPYPVTVHYATQDGAAGDPGVAAAPADYAATSGTLAFEPGETSKTVAVAVAGDALDEVDEGFSLVLSEPTNGTIQTSFAAGRIVDNDAPPALIAGEATVVEGAPGQRTTAVFTVRLSAPSGQLVRTVYRPGLFDDTATRNADYEATADFLEFLPGETEKTVTATVIGDALDEADETFGLLFAFPTNFTIQDGESIATIVDDDPLPTVRINDVTVNEGDAEEGQLATLTVSLSVPSGRPVSMTFRSGVFDDTAAVNADYVPVSGSLTFAPGETTKTIQVRVRGDVTDEAEEETLSVFLAALENGTFADSRGRVFVVDDDAPPTVSVEDAGLAEGVDVTTYASFTVRLSAASGLPVTVAYATADGTATAGSDYEAGGGVVTFAPGETVKAVSVAIRGDADAEADETFTLTLSDASHATLADGEAVGTILNDDAPPPAPPHVVEVFVSGTSWAPAFKERLAATASGSDRFGYSVAGGATQLDEIPWETVNQITLRFDADVAVDQNHLAVRGVNVGSYGVVGFVYDPEAKAATWTLDRPVKYDKLLLDLDGDAGGVARAIGSGAAGPALDGEWSDGSGNFPSGDGNAGGDFEFRLNLLPGDANRSGRVDSVDIVQVRARLGTSASAPGEPPRQYTVFHDLNADGRINALDVAAVRRHLLRRLPAAQPSGVDPSAARVTSESLTATEAVLFGDARVLA